MDATKELDMNDAREIVREMVILETQIESTEAALDELKKAFRAKIAEQRKLRGNMQDKRRELIDRARGVPYTPSLPMGEQV